jgi:hypothetical protein
MLAGQGSVQWLPWNRLCRATGAVPLRGSREAAQGWFLLHAQDALATPDAAGTGAHRLEDR